MTSSSSVAVATCGGYRGYQKTKRAKFTSHAVLYCLIIVFVMSRRRCRCPGVFGWPSCLPHPHHPPPYSRPRFPPSGSSSLANSPLTGAFDGYDFLLWIREAETIPSHASSVAVLILVVEFRAPEFRRQDAVWEEFVDQPAYTAGGGVYGCIFEAPGFGEEEVVDCCWGKWRVIYGFRLCLRF